MSLIAILLSMLRTAMAHPAGADIDPGVAESPVTMSRWQPPLPLGGWAFGKVADGVIGCVLSVGGEIAAGKSNP
jgi:hypothetical protein